MLDRITLAMLDRLVVVAIRQPDGLDALNAAIVNELGELSPDELAAVRWTIIPLAIHHPVSIGTIEIAVWQTAAARQG